MRSKRLILSAIGAAAILCFAVSGFATVVLGSAQSFAVLGAAGVTSAHNTDPVTQIYGNVGVDPGPLSGITGFPPGIVTGGTINGPGGVSLAARLDAVTAYNTLAGLSGTSLTGQNLGGGRTITPGVYTMTDTVALLNGALTLDAQGLSNARFVFNLAAAFTTGSGAVVNVINGDPTTEIYWVVGSSATLGSDTVFAGNILAQASVSLDPRAEILCGRAFALTGAVTLIDNQISNNNSAQDFGSGRSDFGSYGFSGGTGAVVSAVPEPCTMLGLVFGVGAAFIRKRRALRAL